MAAVWLEKDMNEQRQRDEDRVELAAETAEEIGPLMPRKYIVASVGVAAFVAVMLVVGYFG